jgi:glucose-6-phosphate 1-dehydrogenase
MGDAMAGDATLFAREDGVEAARAIVRPILGNVTPAHTCQPGSWGPPESEQLAATVGGWRSPAC